MRMATTKKSEKRAPVSKSGTPKQAAGATGAKRASSATGDADAETLRSSADTHARIAAAKALEKKLTDDATNAILAGALSRDEPVRVAALRALDAHMRLRATRKKPFDLVPAFREAIAALAAVGAGLDAAAARDARDRDAASPFLANLMNTMQHDVASRQDVCEALRELAWGAHLGSATESAQSILAFKRDPDSVERVSHLLGVYAVRSAAATALFDLDPAIAIARARKQIDALSGHAREEAARTLVSNAHYRAKREWKPYFEELAREYESLRSDVSSWASSVR